MKKFAKIFTLAASLTGAGSALAHGGYDADKVDLYQANSNVRGEHITEYVGSKKVADSDGCLMEAYNLAASSELPVEAVCKLGDDVVSVIKERKDGGMSVDFKMK